MEGRRFGRFLVDDAGWVPRRGGGWRKSLGWAGDDGLVVCVSGMREVASYVMMVYPNFVVIWYMRYMLLTRWKRQSNLPCPINLRHLQAS